MSTTVDVRILADATEKLLANLDNRVTVDGFLDQTVHACEHGIGVTELGRLILEDRVKLNPHN
jgi:hypothetical protein